MSKYKQLHDNEPDFILFNKWVRIECCDCGLAHDVLFKKAPKGIYRIIKRNNRSTGQIRRHLKR